MTDLIYPILKARLKVFTDANSCASVEHGKLYEPAHRTLHLRSFFLPAESQSHTLATGYVGRENGIFQVSVYSPEEDRELESRNIAWDVRAHFYPASNGLWLTSGGVTVRIEKPPTVNQTLMMGGYLATPVSIRWFADLLAA